MIIISTQDNFKRKTFIAGVVTNSSRKKTSINSICNKYQRGVGEEVLKWKADWENNEDREAEEETEERENSPDQQDQDRNRRKLREDELLCQRYIRR
jgi:hypothetical protein